MHLLYYLSRMPLKWALFSSGLQFLRRFNHIGKLMGRFHLHSFFEFYIYRTSYRAHEQTMGFNKVDYQIKQLNKYCHQEIIKFTMKYLAAYALISLSGKKDINAADIKKVLGEAQVATDDAEITRLLESVKGKKINELIAEGTKKINGAGSASVSAPAEKGGKEKAKNEPKEKETKKGDEKKGGDDKKKAGKEAPPPPPPAAEEDGDDFMAGGLFD